MINNDGQSCLPMKHGDLSQTANCYDSELPKSTYFRDHPQWLEKVFWVADCNPIRARMRCRNAEQWSLKHI